MKSLLLAAGYATRLYPLTLDKPKALLPVGPCPIIDYILQNIVRTKKIDEVFVVTNHKLSGHFQEWAQASDVSLDIKVIDDGTLSNEDRLGAIVDISFVIKNKNIKDDLLVIGADNIFEAELSDFLKFALSKKDANCIGLYDLGDKKLASQYGVVSIDKNNKVAGFQEKPKEPKSTLISTCIYYFSAKKIGLFEKYLTDKSHSKDASGNYIKWLSENDSVYGYIVPGKWYDIGDIESYKKAEGNFNGGKKNSSSERAKT